MRQIKFRAHSKTGPLWVYGYYKYTRCIDQHKIENENRVYEVHGDTVSQYWRTMNRQELYDGDIFTVQGKYPKLVKWIDEYASFCIANIADIGDIWVNPWQQPTADWFNQFERKIKVIGNIYDTPELVKHSLIDNLMTPTERTVVGTAPG